MSTNVLYDGVKPAGLTQYHSLHVKMPQGLSSAPSAFTPVPFASSLKGGVTGTAYSETIGGQGGTAPYTFALVAGGLPTGTSMSSSGVISGAPSAIGTYSFTITVTDSLGITGSQSFTIIIAAPSSSGGFSYTFISG